MSSLLSTSARSGTLFPRVDVLVEVEGGQDEHLDLGGMVILLDPPGGLDPVLARHADIHKHDVGVVLAGQGDRFLTERTRQITHAGAAVSGSGIHFVVSTGA